MSSMSIVVATLERSGPLAEVLRDVLAQAPADAEVAIVDQSDRPAFEATACLVACLADPRVIHVRLEQRGLPNARNVGLAATSAENVIFLDDDVRLLPGCLDAHARALDRPGVGGVVGRIVERLARPNARPTRNEIGPGGRVVTNLGGRRATPVGCLKGANMSFRREALARVGGWDPTYGGNALLEEADVSARLAAAGYDLWYEPEAVVVHRSVPSGGVRLATRDPEVDAERWRFHNTGYFVRRHRGWRGVARMVPTFTAIAVARAVRWRDPASAASLLGSLGRGLWLAGAPRALDRR